MGRERETKRQVMRERCEHWKTQTRKEKERYKKVSIGRHRREQREREGNRRQRSNEIHAQTEQKKGKQCKTHTCTHR